jgi:hypothetical protein
LFHESKPTGGSIYFLAERKQVVVVEGEKSDSINVESGVPQGSVLEQSLFLFYINDMPEGICSRVRLFADGGILALLVFFLRIIVNTLHLSGWKAIFHFPSHSANLSRPTVEYASSVWDPYHQNNKHRLEMVQRRAARYVTNSHHNTSSGFVCRFFYLAVVYVQVSFQESYSFVGLVTDVPYVIVPF